MYPVISKGREKAMNSKCWNRSNAHRQIETDYRRQTKLKGTYTQTSYIQGEQRQKPYAPQENLYS